jgi:hypothetical protein
MARRWSVALLAVFLSGCVGLIGSTPTPVVVHPHATGQHDLLLRMSIGGGLPWPGKTVDDPPRFSLFGDGLAIYQVNTRSADGTPRSELRAARLDQNQVDALIADALGAGGLLAAELSYRDVDVYDAVTTRFEFHAGGVDKTVGVYALGLQDFLAPSRDERAAFSSLAHRLGDFGADVTAGKATDLGTYQPQAYRVTLKEPYATDTTVRAWPWPDLSAADFDPDADGNLVRIVTADQAQAILGLGVTSDLVVRGPDGHTYLIGIAVALPDQQA